MPPPLSSDRGLSCVGDAQTGRETGTLRLVLPLPSGERVSETSNHIAFDEPVVLWRMRRSGGLMSHAVIGPRSNGAVLVWFINGRAFGYRDFADWTSALRWSEQLQFQNWAVGWRLASE